MGKNKGKLVATEKAASVEGNKKIAGSENVEGNTEPDVNEVSEKTDEPMILAEDEPANKKTTDEKSEEKKDGNEKMKKKKKLKKKKSKKNKNQNQDEKKYEASTGAKNQDEKKPETSTRAKDDLAGLIFMCNSKTKEDCFRYHVFGLPKSQKDLVERVTKGMKLFLYDFELRLMYGIYKAKGRGGLDLQRNAFRSAERPFPAQVRFQIQKDCLPLPEDKFKVAIKDNYYGKSKKKFKFELNGQQVKKLCRLFRPIPRDGRLGINNASLAERRHVPYAENVPAPHLSMPVREMTRHYPLLPEEPHAYKSDLYRPAFGGQRELLSSPLLRGNGRVIDLEYRGVDVQRELHRDQLWRERHVVDNAYLDEMNRRNLLREAEYGNPYLRRDPLLRADTYLYSGGASSAYRY